MKINKVLLLVVIMIMAMMFVFVGCAQPSETSEEPETDQGTESESTSAPTSAPTSESQETQKLVIWTNLTAEAQTVVLTKQFNEIADEMGIEIEMVTVSFGDLYTKLATSMESGDVPDIMHTTEGGVAYLYANNMLTPMSEVIDNIGKEDFAKSYLDILTVDDTVWGVPDWALHTSVWYRKDLFKEYGLDIPQNWEELMEVAKALNIDTNSDGKTDTYGFAVSMSAVQVAAQVYYEFLYSAGVYTFDPETGDYIFGKNKDKAAEVLDYMIELYHAASPPSSTEWAWSEFRNALVEGNVAMTQDMGAVIGLAQSNNPDMVENLGCFDLPGINGDKQASFGGSYNFVAGNQGGDEKAALAKEFIEKLYTPERAAERALSRPMFAFPSTYSAFEIYKSDDSVAQFQEEVDVIYEAFQNSKWYRYGMEAGLSQMASQIEATTFFGEAIQSVALGQWTSEEAVDYIDEMLQEQLAIINE